MLSEVLIWAAWPVELCWSGPQFEPENGSPQSQTDRCFMDLYGKHVPFESFGAFNQSSITDQASIGSSGLLIKENL